MTTHVNETERRPLLSTTTTAHHNEHEPQDKHQQPRKHSYTATNLEQEEQPEEGDEQRDPLAEEASRLAVIEALPWYKRPSLIWLLPFVFLLAIVLGLSQAPQEQLMIKIICKEHLQDPDIPLVLPGQQQQSSTDTFSSSFNNSEYFSAWNRTEDRQRYEADPCNGAPVQAFAALVLSRVRSLKYVTAIFTIGFYTSMSDRYGRKGLIFWTLIPALLTQALILYMSRPGVNLGVWILYVDALMMGLTGGGLLLEPGLSAYIVDCTPTRGRSLAIGYVMVALSTGLVVGPVMGSLLIRWTGQVSTPIMVSVGTLIFLTFYSLVLPESLPKEFRSKYRKTKKVVITTKEKVPMMQALKSHVLEALDPLLLFLPGRIDSRVQEVDVLPSQYTLVIMMIAYGSLQAALSGSTSMLIPFTNLVFKWTPVEDGYYYSFVGVCSFTVYVVIFPNLQKLKRKITGEQTDCPKKSGVNHADESSIPPPPLDQITELPLGNVEPQLLAVDVAAESSPARDQDATQIIAIVRNDLSFVIFGSIFYCLCYLIVPVFKTEASLLVASFMRALGSVAVPSFTSLITTVVPSHQTGKALGGICILDTIVMSASSLLFGWVFSKTLTAMPTAIYLLSFSIACLTILATMSVWFSYRRLDRKSIP